VGKVASGGEHSKSGELLLGRIKVLRNSVLQRDSGR
jgi:hypothetical protein